MQLLMHSSHVSYTIKMQAVFKMLRNIDDISSIFQVSGHLDTISVNDSRLRKISDNIVNISVKKTIYQQ